MTPTTMPTATIEENHATMVSTLMKPPADLHADSTPWKWGVIHAVVGLAGELCELSLATDADHIIEESGDVLFYARDLRHRLEFPPYVGRTVPVSELPSSEKLCASLLDHLKRLTIYNYAPSYTRLLNLLRCVINVEDLVSYRLEAINYTRTDALQHNLDKLLTGPNARYKGGQYTDLAAQLRSDKEGEKDDV